MRFQAYRLGSFLLMLGPAAVTLQSGCGNNENPGSGRPDAATTLDAASDSAIGTQWAIGVESPQKTSLFDAVATDRSGNAYVTGSFWGPGSLELGNGVTVTAVVERLNALLVKYDASGVAQWAQTVAAGSAETGFGPVAIDASDNIYTVGWLNGTAGPVDFGNGVTLTSEAGWDAFFVKYDSSGAAQWARALVGPDRAVLGALTLDSMGNIYTVGFVTGTGTYDFGNGVTVTSVTSSTDYVNSPETAFVVKYDNSGTAQWARAAAGSPVSAFGSVAVDSTGNVYAAGDIAGTGTYDFGNGVTAAGTTSGSHFAREAGANAVLVKFDRAGKAQWARTTVAGSIGSSFMAVIVDVTGNVYTAGAIAGLDSYDFGNGVTVTGTTKNGPPFASTPQGPQYAVIVKYDASGAAQWASTVTHSGAASSYFVALAGDSGGNVYAAGPTYGAGPYDFGNGASVPCALEQRNYPILVKYDSSGAARWARSSTNGGSTIVQYAAVAVDRLGNVYAAGVIGGEGVVDFGSGVTLNNEHLDLDPGGGLSGLLVKYR